MDTSQLTNRIVRAARLDPHLYEEVEADPHALSQAVLVVVLSSLAAGLATISGGGGVGTIVASAVVALAGWYIWAFLTYWIGTRILPEPQTHADHGQLLRTVGFAAAPGLIRIVGLIAPLFNLVFFLANVWMLIAMVVAVRQALDYSSTLRAIGVCLIGWTVQFILAFVVVLLFVR